MEPLPPLLTTARLKPFRQRINRTIMTITDSGYVSMEIMCRHGNLPDNQEIAKEIFHVSPDGRTVEVYQNADGVAAIDGCPVPGQPFRSYTYRELPVKQMKKYQHAFKFVELVKSRTPKIILITDTAHCKLMENSPQADFKAEFNNGSTVLVSKSTVTVADRDGGSLSFDIQSVSQLISSDTLALVQHTQMCHQKCLELEQSVSSFQASDVSQELFPVTIGSTRSPCQIQPDPQTFSCENESQHSNSGEFPVSIQAQSPHTETEAWLLDGLPNVTSAKCAETELSDFVAAQFTEFGGSSRGSSVKSMSRSNTPQKRNPQIQCGQTECVHTQAASQQYPADTVSASKIFADNTQSDKGINHPYAHSNVPITNNTQLYQDAAIGPNFDHLATVPFFSPQDSHCIENVFTKSSLIESSLLLSGEIHELQTGAEGLLDSNFGSQHDSSL
ncbi:serine/threonine-protein kinase plk4, partial [Plakobranchus ocellatus]